MNKQYVLLLVVFAIGALIYGIMSLGDPLESLDIEVKEPFYQTSPENSFTNITIEFNLTNPTTTTIRLRNVMIISKHGGQELGIGKIDELIVEANSNKSVSLIILEDWSNIPSLESKLETEYDFFANSKGILRTHIIEINDIKPTPRKQILLSTSETETETNMPDSILDEFYANIQSGGPPKDGIPPVDNPKYESVSEADKKLNDEATVFLLELEDEVRIYPQRILVWHEIVNEVIDNQLISVTYCPLTGSAIGYYGKLGTYDTNYGTSGKLINSNLVMYDRATDSYWPQILGTSVHGTRKGESLNIFNIVWTRWSLVKEKYPNALILSEDTGFFRNYGTDPYGIYSDPNSYYNSGNPFFPVMNEDNRLEPKEVVTGVIFGENRMAIPKQVTKQSLVINTKIGDHPIVAIYDERLDTVRIFSRKINEIELDFRETNGEIIDQTGTPWSKSGVAQTQEYKGIKLDEITSFDVMWFAWVAFFPNTEMIQ